MLNDLLFCFLIFESFPQPRTRQRKKTIQVLDDRQALERARRGDKVDHAEVAVSERKGLPPGFFDEPSGGPSSLQVGLGVVHVDQRPIL